MYYTVLVHDDRVSVVNQNTRAESYVFHFADYDCVTAAYDEAEVLCDHLNEKGS